MRTVLFIAVWFVVLVPVLFLLIAGCISLSSGSKKEEQQPKDTTIEVPFTYSSSVSGSILIKLVTLPTGERLAVVNRVSGGVAVCILPEKVKP